MASAASCSNGVISTSIPDDVILKSSPLWKNFVIGHFVGDLPHIGTVHSTVNRIWQSSKKDLKIDASFISSTSALFKISDDSVRNRVIRRKFWHIGDVPLVVCDWSPEFAAQKFDLASIPMWVDFLGVPNHLFSYAGLSFLASHIGTPVKLHPSTEKCLRFDVARVLIEVNLQKALPKQIILSAGKFAASQINVSYPWLPPHCEVCNKWGHKKKDSCSISKDSSLKDSHSVISVITPSSLDVDSVPAITASVLDKSTAPVLVSSQFKAPLKSPKSSVSLASAPAITGLPINICSPSRFSVLLDIPEEGEILDSSSQLAALVESQDKSAVKTDENEDLLRLPSSSVEGHVAASLSLTASQDAALVVSQVKSVISPDKNVVAISRLDSSSQLDVNEDFFHPPSSSIKGHVVTNFSSSTSRDAALVVSQVKPAISPDVNVVVISQLDSSS